MWVSLNAEKPILFSLPRMSFQNSIQDSPTGKTQPPIPPKKKPDKGRISAILSLYLAGHISKQKMQKWLEAELK